MATSAPARRYLISSLAPWTPVVAARDAGICPYRTAIHSKGGRISAGTLRSRFGSTLSSEISKSGC